MQISNTLNASYIRIANTPTSSSDTTTSSSSQKTEQSRETQALTTAQKAVVSELQATDTAVRSHERAHIAAGGGVIRGGAVFTYEKAPDNKLYAVAGEVGIDVSEGNTPEETITKMQTVRSAALAPSDPSSADYQVASTASMLQLKAQLELSKANQTERLAKSEERYASANNEESSTLFSDYA